MLNYQIIQSKNNKVKSMNIYEVSGLLDKSEIPKLFSGNFKKDGYEYTLKKIESEEELEEHLEDLLYEEERLEREELNRELAASRRIKHVTRNRKFKK